jgi:hypothetical protein
MADNNRSSRRRNSSSSSKEPPTLISRHPYHTPIDAMTMTSRDLAEVVRDAKTHSKLLSQLDFVNATDAKLHTLFVCGNDRVIKRSLSKDKSIIHPPIALRRTAKQIREFYDSGLSQKYELIKKYKFYITNTSGLITFLESDYTSANLPPPGGSPSVAAGSTKSTHSVTFAEDSTFTVDEPQVCGGITIEYINSMKLDAEKRKDRILGFKHTVREGWFTREQLEHPTNNIGFGWPFCLPVVSCLTSGNDMNEIFWEIEQIDDRTNHEESPDFDKFVIRHIDCNAALGVELTQGLCSGCMSPCWIALIVTLISDLTHYQQKLDLMYLEVIPCNRTKQNFG